MSTFRQVLLYRDAGGNSILKPRHRKIIENAINICAPLSTAVLKLINFINRRSLPLTYVLPNLSIFREVGVSEHILFRGRNFPYLI